MAMNIRQQRKVFFSEEAITRNTEWVRELTRLYARTLYKFTEDDRAKYVETALEDLFSWDEKNKKRSGIMQHLADLLNISPTTLSNRNRAPLKLSGPQLEELSNAAIGVKPMPTHKRRRAEAKVQVYAQFRRDKFDDDVRHAFNLEVNSLCYELSVSQLDEEKWRTFRGKPDEQKMKQISRLLWDEVRCKAQEEGHEYQFKSFTNPDVVHEVLSDWYLFWRDCEIAISPKKRRDLYYGT